MELGPPAVGAQSHSHRTTGEVPLTSCVKPQIVFSNSSGVPSSPSVSRHSSYFGTSSNVYLTAFTPYPRTLLSFSFMHLTLSEMPSSLGGGCEKVVPGRRGRDWVGLGSR